MLWSNLRKTSPSFGQHLAVELSAAEGDQLFVPVGFAHGFITLEPNTLFAYKVSEYYSSEHDSGIRFDDAGLDIDWRVPAHLALTSEKDRRRPSIQISILSVIGGTY